MSDSPYSFYINFEAVLKDSTYKKAQKELEKVLSNMQSKVNDVQEEINKKTQSTTDKMTKAISKVSKVAISTAKSISFFYGKFSLFSSVLGGLAQLKFQQIEDLKTNLDSIGENAKTTYQYLSASDKVIGVNKGGMIDELNTIAKARQNFKSYGITTNPMWSMFGASPEDTVDDVLNKFREKIKTMPSSNAKIFAEKMGFDNIYKIAKLSDDEFKAITNLNMYSADNLKRIEDVAKKSKLFYASLKDTKDQMIITFAPIVISILKTITNFLQSKLMQNIFRGIEGLVDDITKLNNFLNGWLFKGLFSLLVVISGGLTILSSPILLIASLIGGVVIVLQDIYNGVKSFTGGFWGRSKTPAKKSVTEGVFNYVNNKVNPPLPNISNTTNNSINNNANASQKNNIVINVNSNTNNGKEIANDIKNTMQKLIDNNNNKLNNANVFR